MKAHSSTSPDRYAIMWNRLLSFSQFCFLLFRFICFPKKVKYIFRTAALPKRCTGTKIRWKHCSALWTRIIPVLYRWRNLSTLARFITDFYWDNNKLIRFRSLVSTRRSAWNKTMPNKLLKVLTSTKTGLSIWTSCWKRFVSSIPVASRRVLWKIYYCTVFTYGFVICTSFLQKILQRT